MEGIDSLVQNESIENIDSLGSTVPIEDMVSREQTTSTMNTASLIQPDSGIEITSSSAQNESIKNMVLSSKTQKTEYNEDMVASSDGESDEDMASSSDAESTEDLSSSSETESTEDLSSSPETESNEDVYDRSSQPLSIQWLDLKKIAYRLQDPSFETAGGYNLPQGIKTIIKLHNDNVQKQNKKKKKKPDPIYEKGKEFPLNGYRVKCYIRTKTGTTNIAKESDENPKTTQKSDHIAFLFKETSPQYIVALTSGNAWNVVRQYADCTFPVKISERVANPRKIIQIKRRCLFGENVQEDLLRPSNYQFYLTSNLYYFVDSFKSEIKTDSKLFKVIDDLVIIKNPKKKAKTRKGKPLNRYCIRVTTGGIIRILKRFKLDEYPSILDVLAEYVADKTREGMDPMFEFLHFLEPTYISMNKVLNHSLISDVYSKYKETGEIPRLYIRHRHLEDFLLSNSFKIEVKSHKSMQIDSNPPEIEDIINMILKIAENCEQFVKIFKEGELTFVDQGSEKCSEKIIDCIEGEYQYSGNMYFKIRKTWYELTPNYFSLLYDDLKKVISNSLIEEGSEWWLHLPWKGRKTKEEVFNRSYLDLDGFIVLDQILPDGIECCDIIRYTQNPNDPVYLYQVKKGFDRFTRVAASQILIAAKSIRGSITMNQSPNYLEKLFDEATIVPDGAEEWRKKISENVSELGKENFMNLFQNRRIVFVLAILPDKGKSFSKALNEINKGLNPELANKLKCAGYLDKHGRLTNKFHYTTNQDDFRVVDENKQKNIEVYKHLNARRFYYKSTISKLELIHLAQNLQNLNFEFKICEISVQETD